MIELLELKGRESLFLDIIVELSIWIVIKKGVFKIGFCQVVFQFKYWMIKSYRFFFISVDFSKDKFIFIFLMYSSVDYEMNCLIYIY